MTYALGYAVVDFETTGMVPERSDRAIEVGIVLVSPDGTIEHEEETLIRVQRDLGRQDLHHIGAAELMEAPDFTGIAARLRDLLDRRVFVAHNVAFDMRFLSCEYRRIGIVSPVSTTNSLCTMRLGRKLLGVGKLEDCCARLGIINADAHSALSDAHATAVLLERYMGMVPDWPGWHHALDNAASLAWPEVNLPSQPWLARISHRDGDGRNMSLLDHIVATAPGSPVPDAEKTYRGLLDRFLVNQRLSRHELHALAQAAADLRLGRDDCARIHGRYMSALAQSAWDDGMMAYAERDQLHRIADVLGVAAPEPSGRNGRIAATSSRHAHDSQPTVANANPLRFRLREGDHIVLTGQMGRLRAEWVDLLTALGIVVAPSVTRRVKLLVAADVDSESTKARKARDYGIPIVGEDWLERAVANGIDVD